jgi:hypothetical protein
MSLKHIKTQGGNIADLSLNFEVTTQDDMQQSMVSKLGGAEEGSRFHSRCYE